jgi:acyl-CoA thioester hydrolase
MSKDLEFPDFCMTESLVRVRFCDTDMMGVVHHSNYIKYFELARIEYLRRRGLNYSSWVKMGMHLPVLSTSSEHKAPAFLDDLLRVEARLTCLSRVRVGFSYRVRRQADEGLVQIATGSTMLACVGDDHRPIRMSKEAEALILSPELNSGEINL